MNEFKFYGEENTENDDAVQLLEQQAEKEAEKKENTKTLCFGQHGFISVYRVNCGKYDTLLQQEYFSKKKCMQKLCLFYGTVYTCSGRRHFFGIQIYLPLAHNN